MLPLLPEAACSVQKHSGSFAQARWPPEIIAGVQTAGIRRYQHPGGPLPERHRGFQ